MLPLPVALAVQAFLTIAGLAVVIPYRIVHHLIGDR